ncbi:MAG TPA: HNH endonuclease signature motif containing protein [Ornithinibacter sp.]|nr:HNH endonuclease signature motif containing protein [Ornithinibacter sp.]
MVESHRAPGHTALDAPALVSGVLAVSSVHAEHRVRAAVRLAADGPPGSDTATGLGGLHEAMRAGRLDAYRAGVLAQELEEAPAPVRATIVAALQVHLDGEDAAHLRRRCRRLLARVSPDLLRQRARRARAESGLRRWADEPGVDHWEGTFPSEDAAPAWAALDALAQQYRTNGMCPTIDRARAKALTDLVAGHATIHTTITLTIPADATDTADALARFGVTDPAAMQPDAVADATSEHDPAPDATLRQDAAAQQDPALPDPDARQGRCTSPEDLVEVAGPHAGNHTLVPLSWVTQAMAGGASVRTTRCHRETGALLPDNHAGTDTAATGPSGSGPYRPNRSLAALVRQRDGRCRFPGCTVAARFCDLDHVRPWPAGPTRADNLACLCRRHHRVKQRHGWTARLTPDAVLAWTTPTGHTRTTHPVDALHGTVLPGDAPPTDPPATPTSRPRTLIPDGPHTPLEYILEHHGAAAPWSTSPPLADGHRAAHPDISRPPTAGRDRPHLHLDPGIPWPHLRSPTSRATFPTGPPPF